MFGFNSLKNKISSALNKNSRKHSFLNFADVKKVLILFTYEDWNEVSDIASDLEKDGKEVVLWTACWHKESTGNVSFTQNVRIIIPKEKTKLQGLSAAVTDEFLKLEYDTLFDLTTKDDKVLQYLLAQNSAYLCVGTREQELKFYDFILLREENVNLNETYKQIKNYLNNMC